MWGLERAKADVTLCEVNRQGGDIASILAALKPSTKLVVVMLAQNELGNIYPIRDIVEAVSPCLYSWMQFRALEDRCQPT